MIARNAQHVGRDKAPRPAACATDGGVHEDSHTPSNPRTLNSRELLAGQSSVLIRHLDGVYRLQITRQGKLILTK